MALCSSTGPPVVGRCGHCPLACAPGWVITPASRIDWQVRQWGRLPFCGFPRPDCALTGRSGGMFPWTLAISSTSEMFAERFDSAIYLWPSFSVISFTAETFAECLGQALCFGPLTGRTARTSPLAGVSSPLVLAVFSVQLLCMVHDVDGKHQNIMYHT